MNAEKKLDFQHDVIERSREIPVLVDFWAEWCAPCRMLAPLLEKLAASNTDRWELVKIDTEEHQDIAANFKVRSIPNVKLFVDGVVIDEFSGALPEYQLQEWLKKAVPSPYEKDIEAAMNCMLQGEPSKAAVLLEGVLHKEPENLQVISLLARVYLFSHTEEALRLCAFLEHEPQYASLSETIRTIGRLITLDPSIFEEDTAKKEYLEAISKLRQEDFDGAIERFIGVLKENRYYDDDGSRKACIAIFRFLGEEHEITMKHRRSFDRAF
ncbi:MAG: thioredoxin [Chlorobiaceae bacterium]|nr:thioredoxin [Chlorobiaceae bacterium]